MGRLQFATQKPISISVTGGVAATSTIDIGDVGHYSAIEADLVISALVGAGVTPTLDVKIQGSLDNFVTSNLIRNIIQFTQVTSAGSESKAAERTFDAEPILFGQNLRVYLAAGTASGAIAFTGTLYIFMFDK